MTSATTTTTATGTSATASSPGCRGSSSDNGDLTELRASNTKNRTLDQCGTTANAPVRDLRPRRERALHQQWRPDPVAAPEHESARSQVPDLPADLHRGHCEGPAPRPRYPRQRDGSARARPARAREAPLRPLPCAGRQCARRPLGIPRHPAVPARPRRVPVPARAGPARAGGLEGDRGVRHRLRALADRPLARDPVRADRLRRRSPGRGRRGVADHQPRAPRPGARALARRGRRARGGAAGDVVGRESPRRDDDPRARLQADLRAASGRAAPTAPRS